jgi:hypothetical protein
VESNSEVAFSVRARVVVLGDVDGVDVQAGLEGVEGGEHKGFLIFDF